MSDVIHLLPDSIANQIAAGEVIQRPASVVKELVENAVDAGATSICVTIKDAGRTLIQVIDNGKGMSEADARMAFERHATSKISTADDLFSLRTMGFRGEALASIAAVAHVNLRTCQQGVELGIQLTIAGSVLGEIESVSCAEGSVFSVKNLFYNVPARRKFLKSNETEFRHIVAEFERVALVNHQIAFSLFHNDVEVMQLPETGIRQRILNVYGKGLNGKLLSVHAQSALVNIEGFVGSPESAKKRGALQAFFVNGRFMRHPYFHKAIMQAYEQLIPVGEYPNYFIYFTLDPSTIDVNIHPTKTEIKFENEQPIWQILVAAVRESLAKSSAIPTIDFNTEDAIDIPVYTSSKDVLSMSAPTVQVDASYNPFKTSGSSYQRPEFDWTKLYNDFESDIAPEEDEMPKKMDIFDDLATKDEIDESLISGSFPSYQYKGRYIVTSLKSGLAIIDQHRAHVRVLYDQYLNNIKQKKGISQQVLFPEIVVFTPVEMAMLPILLEEFCSVGFDMTDLGQGSYAINGLPVGVEHLDPIALMKDMVACCIETGKMEIDQIDCSLALTMAKSAAISSGKPLSAEEIEHLIASLFSSSDSYLTPDGKTILTLLTDEELEKRF